MKFKSIITCGLLLLGVGAATTSCEDMFTPDNNLVTTELAPQDTLYQMMGIVQRMQKLADRTVMLGEVRADLVEVQPLADSYIQQLGSNAGIEPWNDATKTGNIYNNASDYYAVINSCNIYLSYVDSLLTTHGESYYGREICAAKCFRAWCYLELAKNYGEVPFVTEPVLSAAAADEIVNSGNKLGMADICSFLINDLSEYPNMNKNMDFRPEYGTTEWNGLRFSNFFIPARVMLAELYLWRGSATGSKSDYAKAAGLYHDFFCFTGEERGVGMTGKGDANNPATPPMCYWQNRSFDERPANMNYGRDLYKHSNTMQNIAILPMDTSAFYGNVTEIRSAFNSMYKNDYYPSLMPSTRLRDIVAKQEYCFFEIAAGIPFLTYAPQEKNKLTDDVYIGDLRFSSLYYTASNIANTQYNANLSPTLVFISKWLDGANAIIGSDTRQNYIPLFRTNILYLHMAEALNRGGFPETAFAVLKYGLTYKVMNDRSIISQDEYDRLCAIKTAGYSLVEPKIDNLPSGAANSFVIWPSNVFDNPNINDPNYPASLKSEQGASIIQIGVHGLGCGTVEKDSHYALDDADTYAKLLAILDPLPTIVNLPETPSDDPDADTLAWKNSIAEYNAVLASNAAKEIEFFKSDEIRQKRQAAVAKLILDEEALEGMFEGHRFYDLLRYQMQEGKASSSASSVITLPAYIAEKYGSANVKMEGKPWYLKLSNR